MWEALILQLRPFIQIGAFFAVAIYAWFKGDPPERYCSLAFVGAIVLDQLHHATFPDGRSYAHVNLGHLVIDILLLVALSFIAMRANRIYPLWLLAAQVIATAMHFERGTISSVHPFAYWTLERLPSYLQLVTLIAGVWAFRLRVRKGIHARPWRMN